MEPGGICSALGQERGTWCCRTSCRGCCLCTTLTTPPAFQAFRGPAQGLVQYWYCSQPPGLYHSARLSPVFISECQGTRERWGSPFCHQNTKQGILAGYAQS